MHKNNKQSGVLLIAAAAVLILSSQTPLDLLKDNTGKSRINSAVQRELRILNSEFSYNMNPHTANYSSEAQILTGLFEGLFSYDPYSLEALPAVAESYKLSRDKKTWTFTLRSNAKFSNNDSISAQSVYDSWIRLLSPAAQAPFASLLDCIEGVEEYRTGKGTVENVGIKVSGPQTLVVKLQNPTEHFPKILCHHAFSVVHKDASVYSGAYSLFSLHETEIILKKNNNYWDSGNVALPSIRLILSDDLEENTFLYNTGSIDWACDAVNAGKIIDKNSVVVSTQFGTEYLFFKSHRAPWNSDTARNALLYAVPWEELRSGSIIPADTLLVQLRGYPDIAGLNDQDIDEAKRLLEEAEIPLEQRKITCAVPDNSYIIKQMELLKTAWEQIGVTLEIQKTPTNRYLQSIQGWDADVFTYTWIGDFADPLAFLELFRSNSSLNETQWVNNAYDKLLSEASQMSDSEQRYNKLAEAETLLLDQAVIIPVSHPVSFNVIDRNLIGGWYDNALDIHPLKYLYFNETKPIQGLVLASK
ncbi:MAG TPA: peptide ABC transporter substrate-binding protein [Treponemataceae bacterium]|nr:peptide ABC transporter substrate-binding protein [Treponemataceae bacterium]